MGGLFTTFLFWGARDVLMGASQNHCFVIPLMNGRATCVRCLCLEVKVSHAYRVNYSSLARTSAFVVWRRYNYAPQVRKRDEQIIIEGPWSQGWDYPIPVRSNPRARARIGCLSVYLSLCHTWTLAKPSTLFSRATFRSLKLYKAMPRGRAYVSINGLTTTSLNCAWQGTGNIDFKVKLFILGGWRKSFL